MADSICPIQGAPATAGGRDTPPASRNPLCARDGCENPLPAAKCRPRLYCSDRCRRSACEDRKRARCVNCGTLLGPGSTWRGAERCDPCARAVAAAAHERRLAHAVRLYDAGMPAKEIARAAHIGERAITAMRRAGRVSYRYPGWSPSQSAARDERLIALYETGMPITRIAEQLGVTTSMADQLLTPLRRSGRIRYRRPPRTMAGAS